MGSFQVSHKLFVVICFAIYGCVQCDLIGSMQCSSNPYVAAGKFYRTLVYNPMVGTFLSFSAENLPYLKSELNCQYGTSIKYSYQLLLLKDSPSWWFLAQFHCKKFIDFSLASPVVDGLISTWLLSCQDLLLYCSHYIRFACLICHWLKYC